MRTLNIVTSPRKERSASVGIIDSFLVAYQEKIKGLEFDTLNVWTELLPECGGEATGAKYKDVSGEGIHFVQEDSPDKIGEALAMFVRSLRRL